MSLNIWGDMNLGLSNGFDVITSQYKYKDILLIPRKKDASAEEIYNWINRRYNSTVAISEISSTWYGNNAWYGGSSKSLELSKMFLSRGGISNLSTLDTSNASNFSYIANKGEASSSGTFRVSISPKMVTKVNHPKLTAGMTPIKWDNNFNEIKTNTNDKDWYDYNNAKWANAKTKDGSYWVWIPRYAYKINSCYHLNHIECNTYNKRRGGNVEVKFLKNKTNTTYEGDAVELSPKYKGSMQTNFIKHPAFTFDGKEIEGFWIAKFQMSGSIDDLQVLPNKKGLYTPNFSLYFTKMLELKEDTKFGWNTSNIDTHMIKNIEWGALSFLAISEFGSYIENAGNKIWVSVTGCAYPYYLGVDLESCQTPYNTIHGGRASTTYNITGVYDAHGAQHEIVAAFLLKNNKEFLKSRFKSIYDSYLSDGDKYVDVYTHHYTPDDFGSAMYEVSNVKDFETYLGNTGWFIDGGAPMLETEPFLSRGSYRMYGDNSGILAFYRVGGLNSTSHGSRVVLINKTN